MIIFLYGDDSFRSRKKVQGIKDKYLTSDPSGSGLSIFDFLEKGGRQGLVPALSMANLLAPKRLVIVKNMIAQADKSAFEELLEFFGKSGKDVAIDKDLVVVFWEEKMPNKKNALFDFLEKNAQKQVFEKLAAQKIIRWISERAREINPAASFSAEAAERLVMFVGTDLQELDMEIRKLANFREEGAVTGADVELLVRAKADANIFNTIDAIGSGDKKRALLMLHEHIAKGDDPFYLLSMINYQFRNLIKIADLQERIGEREQEIAKAAKIHPFVIRKSLAQLRNFARHGSALESLKRIYQKISELDAAVKTGKIEIVLALDKFIAEL